MQKTTFTRHLRIFLALAALLALLACTPGTQTRPYGPHTGTKTPYSVGDKQPHAITLEDIEEVFNNGNYPLAERLAQEYASRPGLEMSQLGRVWRVMGLAAIENKNTETAINGLDRWRRSVDGADGSPEWCEAWYNLHSLMPFELAQRRAEAVISASPPRPARLVREAKLFIQEQRLAQGNGRAAIPALSAIYNAASPSEKSDLEARTWAALHRAEPAPLSSLMTFTSDENEMRYPYALIRLENARRISWDLTNQELAQESVRFLRDGSNLIDKGIFDRWNYPDYSTLKRVRVRNSAIALVLPMTGQYGNLSEKISSGADTARRALEANGQRLRIHVIDSDQPGWLLQLTRLPENVKIVGGPLRMDDYSAVKNAAFAGGRFFFSFLPRMHDQDEGRIAWRFFPSREDQVRVMLDYAQKLGIANYAIFAPDPGDYSKSMFDLFSYEAAGRHLNITKAAYYPAKQYQEWVKSVSEFLGYSREDEKAGIEQPELDFQALFLPDNWSNSARMINHVFYTMENKLVFMGTNLWEHGLAGQDRLTMRNFRLAIFPGAWDQQNMSPSTQTVRASAALTGRYNADFWFSLGFDFVLAATGLDLPQNARAEDVNAALAALPPKPWSGAPISWDKQGFATQELFVLAPAENGFVRAKAEKITKLMKEVKKPVRIVADEPSGMEMPADLEE